MAAGGSMTDEGAGQALLELLYYRIRAQELPKLTFSASALENVDQVRHRECAFLQGGLSKRFTAGLSAISSGTSTFMLTRIASSVPEVAGQITSLLAPHGRRLASDPQSLTKEARSGAQSVNNLSTDCPIAKMCVGSGHLGNITVEGIEGTYSIV